MEKIAEHKIKIKRKYYLAVQSGEKTFEIRKNDRNYQVGDIIHFIPTCDESNLIIPHNPNSYRITYVFHGGEYGLASGYCIFGIVSMENEFFNFNSPVVNVDDKIYNRAIWEFTNWLCDNNMLVSKDDKMKCIKDVIRAFAEHQIAESMKGEKE